LSANPSTTNTNMKSNSSLFPVAAMLFSGLIAISGTNSANAQSLDPQTGMPIFGKRGTAHLDPASGLPGSDSTNAAQTERANILEIGAINAETAAARDQLANVIFLTRQGRYEEALQRCLTSQSQPKTEFESQLLFSQWTELGRHYPPAEQALRKIRDDDVRQFSEAGGGSQVLFAEVAGLNRDLQDEDATCALFKQIASQNPPLAGYFYPVAEDLLMSKGEYPLCLCFIGDPQARFESGWQGLEFDRSAHQRLEEFAKNYQPPLVMPDMLPGATNSFVKQVCNLVEILVANGDRANAEKIRNQAVARLDDPGLSSAISNAEENIKKHGVVQSPATGLPQYAGDRSRAGSGLFLASATPTKAIHTRPPFMQVMIRSARGEYDQALRLILDLRQKPNFPVVAVVLPDWMELSRIYPPARQSMIEIRDRDTREFEQAKNGLNVGLFMEASLLNNALGETKATYAMCQHLQQQNPAQFQACFYLLEPLLMQRGDYQLCLKYIGDPQANLEMMRTNLEFMRKVLPLWRENQIKSRQQTEKSLNKARQFMEELADKKQQFEQGLLAQRQQFRQDMWAKLRTNTPDADEMPLLPPPNYLPLTPTISPRLVNNFQLPPAIDSGLTVTNGFVNRVCVLVDVLVAAGHRDEAEKIRDEAVAILDDERLRSAVSDAEQKLAK
jgi:hypothetical protein